MHQSKTTAAHFTYVEEVDVTELVALRERAKVWAQEKGIKLTYLPFMLKALVAALKEHPWLNSTVDWEANEVHLKKYYNIGIATATDQGLLVPVLKDVEGKSLFTIAKDKEVNKISHRLRVKGTATTGDYHRVGIIPFCGEGWNPAQVQHVQYIGIGKLVAQ